MTIVRNGFDTIDLRSLRVSLDIPIRTVGGPVVDAYEWQWHFGLYTQPPNNNQFFLASYTEPKAPYGLGGLPLWAQGNNTPIGGIWFAKSQTVECQSGINYYQRTEYSQPFFVDSSGITHTPDLANLQNWHYYPDPLGSCQNATAGWTSPVTLYGEGMYFDGTNFPNSGDCYGQNRI
jgi:hypothetical protein